jgi:hypothetical protein
LFPRHKFRKYEVVKPASVKPASGEVVKPASEPISDHDIFLDGALDHLLGGNPDSPESDGEFDESLLETIARNSTSVTDGNTFFQPPGTNNSLQAADHDNLITMVDKLLTLISDKSDEADSATGRVSSKKRQIAEV